jgi:hypothetical protein
MREPVAFFGVHENIPSALRAEPQFPVSHSLTLLFFGIPYSR